MIAGRRNILHLVEEIGCKVINTRHEIRVNFRGNALLTASTVENFMCMYFNTSNEDWTMKTCRPSQSTDYSLGSALREIVKHGVKEEAIPLHV